MDMRAEYLKNELRNYNYLKRWVSKQESVYDSLIAFCDGKLKDIDNQLSAGNAKGIDYFYTPTTAVQEPLLSLLAEEEKYINRRNELGSLKASELDSHKYVLSYLDNCLDKLEGLERQFIIDYYINGRGIDEIKGDLGRSRSRLYADREKIIIKMLK